MIGTKLAHYEITSHLGSGGMGEVYQATDSKLGRRVAIKVLPDGFSHDPERAARFEREAQVLASLNHPNIAAIYGIEQSSDRKFIVMELVGGETLAERIKRGPIPVEEALDIAKQIAEALEAAHENEKIIIHRDLKPANVMITRDGRVKVLDFGLAKAYGPPSADVNLSNSPTRSMAATNAGVILGTAAYMSPEQVRGKAVDVRADVWAFGCVLFEMLTARQAFPNGETASDTIAGILTREPEWQRLPGGTPSSMRKLIERCLRKDPSRRLRNIADVRIEIEDIRNEILVPVADPTKAVARSGNVWVAALVLGFVILAVGALLAWLAYSPAPAAEALAVRFEVVPPEGADFPGPGASFRPFALSPDGRSIAFPARLGTGRVQIWVRPIDSSTAHPLSGTEGTLFTGPTNASLFWSADSQYIGFFETGKLKKIPASGGPAETLADIPFTGSGAGTWNADGAILISANGTGGTILRIPAGGGKPIPETELNPTLKETAHQYPNFLPDGRHYFYLAVSSGAQTPAVTYIGELGSKERRPLQGVASEVMYASTGHIIFARNRTLMAQPFDLTRLEASGNAFPVGELGPSTSPAAFTGQYSVSATGALAFRTMGNSQLAWFDRIGRLLEVVGPTGDYLNPALSPDGKYIVFQRDTPADLWVLDLEKRLTSRFTSDAGAENFPIWSPDGQTVVFNSNRDGIQNVYARPFGIDGEEKLLVKSETQKVPTDWSRDGRYVIYDARPAPEGGPRDLWARPMSGDTQPVRLTDSPLEEYAGRISPNGHWMAYLSLESGSGQIYIRSFPNAGVKQQVSTNGGSMPRWSNDGKELFYVQADRTLMAIPITATDTTLRADAPKALFQTRLIMSTQRDYDVSADGRFLMNVTPSMVPITPITVILNWPNGLKND